GKSTLVKILAGRLEPLSGNITKSKRLRVGYFAQHQTEELDVEAPPFILMERARPRDNEPQVRAQLGRFGFQQERAETKVGNLSGGEKARLNFALITADKPNILLLDEPTNHLDVDSRQALIQALNSFNGTVILVSHDPHLIETTVDTFWLVEGGDVIPFDGDLDDYRSRLLGRRQAERGETPKAKKEKPVVTQYVDKKEARRAAAAKRALIGPLKKETTDCEAWVKRLERKKAELAKELANPKLYVEGADKGHVIELQMQSAKMERDLSEAEQAWLGALDALEKAQN
ncbi:MAG: ATP-binding cassette domain-containing protein, partial [Rhodospirillaceae bacterium]|nr:ATP-binding cassette domain-containing protein [Rhodospirillaceae bacterium]